MEKDKRSKSSHLFEKESVFMKTLRNANNVSRQKIPPLILSQTILATSRKKEESFQADKQQSPTKPTILKDLRQDLLYIPKEFLEEPPNSNPNNSFVSFNEIHKKQPKLFPFLNYVSVKEMQAEEEKKKKEENMTALDKFFKDMKRDSTRISVSLNRYTNYREFGQVMKELNHNFSQRRMYDDIMDRIQFSSKENLLEKYREWHKRMPPVKIYSTQNEKLERLQNHTIPIKGKTKKEANFAINYMDVYSTSKLSFYKYENILGIKPIACEGATLSVIEDKAFLIGGRGVNFITNIACFKLVQKKWKFLKPSTTSILKDKAVFARSNHCAVVFRNSIVVFGGEKEYNINMKARQCLSGVEVYNVENNEWSTLHCKGDTPEARKNHIGVLVGTHVLIHGGTNSFSKCLKDSTILDLAKSQWINCDNILELPALNGHTAVFVAENEKKYSSLFYPRIEIRQNNNSMSMIKEEGIYMFGGKNSQNQSNNNLTIIKTGVTPFRIIKNEHKGTPPQPRYNHSMKFLKYLNCIVIYGGRNDELKCCFSDIFALNLENMNWVKLISVDNKNNDCKSSFASDLYKTRLLVFGGINFDGFINNDLYAVEFDDNSQKKKSIEQSMEFSPHDAPPIVERKLHEVRTFLPVPTLENNKLP